jgi:hypothetical protein
MEVLPPLYLMKQWREEEGLSPQQVKGRAEAWLEQFYRVDLDPRKRGRPAKSKAKVEKSKADRGPRQPLTRKLPELPKILELYQDHSIPEIAAMYGCSRELVSLSLRATGAVAQKRAKRRAELLEKVRVMKAVGKSLSAIAEALGVSASYCGELAKEAGFMTKRHPIVCDECDTAPYAKGLCKRCYEWARMRLAELTPEERARVEARARLAGEARAKGRPPAKSPRPETLVKVRMLKDLRRQGKTFKQIQAETGIWTSTACTLLKRYGNKL